MAEEAIEMELELADRCFGGSDLAWLRVIELAGTGSILVYDPRYSHDYRFPPEKADRSTEDLDACSINSVWDLQERFEMKSDYLERLRFQWFSKVG